jgi:hypothetical protein
MPYAGYEIANTRRGVRTHTRGVDKHMRGVGMQKGSVVCGVISRETRKRGNKVEELTVRSNRCDNDKGT